MFSKVFSGAFLHEITSRESQASLMTEISWNLLAQIIFHPTHILAVDLNTARRYLSHNILIITGHFKKLLLIPIIKVIFSENGF